MAFVSLYRKYRSQTFADLVGQEHIVRTLQNAIAAGKHSHAYLFTGPRGTGKTSTARLLAKALCCEHGPVAEPCNECWICESISQGNCFDVVEIDAASESGVDEVREQIVEKADYQPSQARFRVYIIDEVHDLSAKAFDALLKTIEEPPAHLVFILATTEFNKVPRTIQSRCQKFEFHRGSLADLTARLRYVAEQENIEFEPAALASIARMADGGYRDALTLLEQAALTSDGPITVGHVYAQFGWVDDASSDAILLAVCEKDVPRLLTTLDTIFGSGRDPRAIVESLIYRLAELTSVIYGVAQGGEEDATLQAATHETAVRIGPERLLALRGQLADVHKTLRDISLPRLWLESQLLCLASVPIEKPAPTVQPVPSKAAVVETVSQKPEPVVEPKPKPEATPKTQPQAATAEPPRPKHPEAAPTGDPDFDRAQAVWHQTVTDLGGLSKSMALKLASTVVSKFENGRLSVRFDRQIERDWVTESDKRQHAILEMVRKHAGAAWNVEYTVAPRTNGEAAHTPAVELPVEGERLAEMAKEILGGI